MRLAAELESIGHRVVGLAGDGQEAVARAARLQPDVTVVSSQSLDPGLTARTILAHRLLPIIIVAAYTPADLVRRAREAGVMACVATPANRWQLASIIDVALARFRELEAIRAETASLDEALEARTKVERAKRVLMRRLKLPESEAFRRLQQQSRSAERPPGSTAAALLQTEDLLFGEVNGIRTLRLTVGAIRRRLRLRRSPAGVQGVVGVHPQP